MDYHPELEEFLIRVHSDYFLKNPIKVNFNDWYDHTDDARVISIEGLDCIIPSDIEERFYFDVSKIASLEFVDSSETNIWKYCKFNENIKCENTKGDQKFWKGEYETTMEKYKKYEEENLIEDDEIGKYTQVCFRIYSRMFRKNFKIHHIFNEKKEEIKFNGILILDITRDKFENGKIKENIILDISRKNENFMFRNSELKDVPERREDGSFIFQGQMTKGVRSG